MFGKVKDPVCGVRVKKSTQYTCSLNGKTFYFDSAACKTTFKEDPHRFLRGKKKKSFLETLTEASDGRPKTCH
jgi:YHS domain-containing protein